MITQIKVWEVTCDQRKMVFKSSAEMTEEYFHTKKDAIEIIVDEGWHYGIVNRKTRFLCDKCQ